MKRVIGIDLGTTNSCVAFVEQGRARVIPNRAGYRTTPSCVAFDRSAIHVGQTARRMLLTNPKNTVMSAKRLLGRSYQSLESKAAAAMYAYELQEGPSGEAQLSIDGKAVSIQQVSALILSEMRKTAEDYLDQPIEDVVITVPAYFNEVQRQATREAGQIAGLNVLRMINEPTAAALAYGYHKKQNKRIVVYDLGGGTFDVSILEVHDGVFRVLATAGDTFLGGDDIDRLLLDRCVDLVAEAYQVDVRSDGAALARMAFACEQAKQDLSIMQTVDIQLPFLKVGHRQPINFTHTIAREELENMSVSLVEKTLACVARCVREAGLAKDDLDDVLLVGGQTRMPYIADRVSNFFGRTASRQINPDEAVALGAAIHGHALLSEKDEGVLLLDVIPKTLGIKTAGGIFTSLIAANTSLPVTARRLFNTAKEGQTQVRIEVFQGSHAQADQNEALGDFVFADIRSSQGPLAEIEVSFSVDANGLLKVSAKELASGREHGMHVRTGRLSSEDIARMSLENQTWGSKKENDAELDLPANVVHKEDREKE